MQNRCKWVLKKGALQWLLQPHLAVILLQVAEFGQQYLQSWTVHSCIVVCTNAGIALHKLAKLFEAQGERVQAAYYYQQVPHFHHSHE